MLTFKYKSISVVDTNIHQYLARGSMMFFQNNSAHFIYFYYILKHYHQQC